LFFENSILKTAFLNLFPNGLGTLEKNQRPFSHGF